MTVAVSLAAGLGALCRYLLGLRLHRGTFWVNVSGSFLLGLVLGLAEHQRLDADVAVVLGAGFAGGFTTLSTWAWETLELAQRGEVRSAAINTVCSFAAGMLAAAVGFGLALI